LIFDEEPCSLLVETMPFLKNKSTVYAKWHVFENSDDVDNQEEHARNVNFICWIESKFSGFDNGFIPQQSNKTVIQLEIEFKIYNFNI